MQRLKAIALAALLGLALSAALFVALPATAYAADWHVSDGNNSTPNGLAYALGNYAPGDTIYLGNDVTMSSSGAQWGSSLVAIDDSLTIDLAGFDLVLDGVAIYVGDGASLTVESSGGTGGALSLYELVVQGTLFADIGSIELTDGSVLVDGPTASVSVSADITAQDDVAVYASNAAQVRVTGDIKTNSYDSGVSASGGAAVEVNGDISAGSSAVQVDSGAQVTVVGDLSAVTGVYADAGAASVTVTGDIVATGYGALAFDGSEVTVNGNITVMGVGGAGAAASAGGTVTVNGTLYVEGTFVSGVWASDGGSIQAHGNVMVSGTNVVGARAENSATSGGTVTVNGTITLLTSGTYVRLYSSLTSEELNLTKTGFTTPSTLAGYYTYTNTISTVWVRDPADLIPTNGVIFVDKNVVGGTGKGDSWANAVPELADALLGTARLNCITAGTVTQIWVANGTYYPIYSSHEWDYDSTTFPITSYGRHDAFVLPPDVAIYGGFTGTEALLSERDWAANPTILSGDIGTPGSTADNCYHVVISAGAVGTASLDGFTISGGNADGGSFSVTTNGESVRRSRGGGIAVSNSSPALTNLSIIDNSADYEGGGISITSSSPTLSNVTISGNKAENYCSGGMYNYDSSPVLINVLISGNYAWVYGGGMYNDSSAPALTNVTISSNCSDYLGGGMYNVDSTPGIGNSIIWGNSAMSGGNSAYNVDSDPSYSYSLVQRNSGTDPWDTSLGIDSGNNLGCDVDPLFVSPAAASGAPITAGNYRLQAGSPAIDVGSDVLVPTDVTTDLEGNPRFVGRVDMGAYEAPGVAPVITSASSTSVMAGTGGTFLVTATGTSPITFSLAGPVPPGVSIDASTGLMTIADSTAAGEHIFAITAANGVLPNDTQVFTLTVCAEPSITGPVSMALTEGYAATSTAAYTITGWPQPTVSVSGNPAMTWNGSAGVLDIPAGLAAGTYTVTLEASNGIGTAATMTITVNVQVEGTPDDGDDQGADPGESPPTTPPTGDPAAALLGAAALLSASGIFSLTVRTRKQRRSSRFVKVDTD